jgi:hypothetical protein
MVTARQFWDAFCREVRSVSPGGHGAAWTTSMCDVLHGVQRSLGLWCQCRAHPSDEDGGRGERMGIDFTWYGKGDDPWVPPLVAIEHGDLCDDFERQSDHWKVNMIATPLRVFIGYTRSPDQAEDAASKLMVHERKWYRVENGETLVVLGHGRMESEFRAWTTPQGQPSWTELR